MVGCIVHHEDSCPPPLSILGIKMRTQLGQEESVSMLVGNTNVHSVEQLASTTECSYQVNAIQSSGSGHLILLVLAHPPMLAMICIPDYWLVDVNDSVASVHNLNELGSSELPLEFGSCIVLDDLDWFDLTISCCKFTPQVPTNPRSTYFQLALGHELMLKVTELKWAITCLEQLPNNVTGSLVQLWESTTMNSSCACTFWIQLT